MKNSQHYVPGVLIWGVVGGLLGGVPCLSAINLLCCFWSVVAAALAVRSVAQKAQQSIDVGEGAVIGLVVGLIGGFVSGVLLAITSFLTTNASTALMQQLPMGQLDPRTAELLQNPGVSALSAFCCVLMVTPLFAALGGMLGAVMFTIDRPGGPPVGPSGGPGFGAPTPSEGPGGYPAPYGGAPPAGGGYGGPPPAGGGYGGPPYGGAPPSA